MKVILDIDPKYEQDEIVIRCAEMNDELLKIVSLANSAQKKVIGSIDRQTFVLNPSEVYYFESVDDKVFILSLIHIWTCFTAITRFIQRSRTRFPRNMRKLQT